MAPELSALGFLSAVVSEPEIVNLHGDWLVSFSRLKDKEPLPIDRQAFTFRPLEFLGICIGATKIARSALTEVSWLRGIISKQRKQLHGNWPIWLSCAAAIALSGQDDHREAPTIEELPVDELALLTWLRASSTFCEAGFWSSIDPKVLYCALLRRSAVDEILPVDSARAAIIYGALKLSVQSLLRSAIDEAWQVSRSEFDAVNLVTNICRRFNRMAQQLKARHGNRESLCIKDEYDVQDLMHATLLLFFDDVREETWTPNYAGNSSRTDLVLWKEAVVVEAKMTRKTLGQKDITDQLIIDRARYATDPKCKTLICFVYDPEGWCKNPAALESDLSQESSPKTRVVVFSGRG